MDIRLKGLVPVINRILSITGQPGVSVGVIHDGRLIFSHHAGFRDIDSHSPPNSDTLYCIGSLSKAFIAASLAALIHENGLSWDTKAADLVCGLQSITDPVVSDRMTLRDMLSHRTGLIALDQLIQGPDGRILVPKTQVIDLMNRLPARSDLRSEFWYCNVPYSLAGDIIEKHGGCGRWDGFLSTKLLQPLGMNRTTSDVHTLAEDDNLATPYVCLPDGTLRQVPQPELSASTLHGCSGGIRSSLGDMLKWSQALLSARSDKASCKLGKALTGIPSIPCLAEIFRAATIIDPKTTAAGEYCLGWVRQSTPATLGMISPNRRFASPCVGEDSPSHLIYSHNGDVNGYTASMYLVPGARAAVVALTNGTGRGDCTDWITQLILQEVLELHPRIDYLSLTKTVALKYPNFFKERFAGPLAQHQTKGTKQPDRREYLGTFALAASLATLKLQVQEEDVGRGLRIVVNGHGSQAYKLWHYHFDTWCLLPATYEIAIARGYCGFFYEWDEYLVRFGRQANGTIWSLTWKLDSVDVIFQRIE